MGKLNRYEGGKYTHMLAWGGEFKISRWEMVDEPCILADGNCFTQNSTRYLDQAHHPKLSLVGGERDF